MENSLNTLFLREYTAVVNKFMAADVETFEFSDDEEYSKGSELSTLALSLIKLKIEQKDDLLYKSEIISNVLGWLMENVFNSLLEINLITNINFYQFLEKVNCYRDEMSLLLNKKMYPYLFCYYYDIAPTTFNGNIDIQKMDKTELISSSMGLDEILMQIPIIYNDIRI